RPSAMDRAPTSRCDEARPWPLPPGVKDNSSTGFSLTKTSLLWDRPLATAALAAHAKTRNTPAIGLDGENMAYDLDRFIADCRSFLADDSGPAGREQVRRKL